MAGKPETEHEAIYRRAREKIASVPPGDRYMAAGPLTLEFGRRLRELEIRVDRIERHLNPPPPLDWPKSEPLKPIEPLKPKGE